MYNQWIRSVSCDHSSVVTPVYNDVFQLKNINILFYVIVLLHIIIIIYYFEFVYVEYVYVFSLKYYRINKVQ